MPGRRDDEKKKSGVSRRKWGEGEQPDKIQPFALPPLCRLVLFLYSEMPENEPLSFWPPSFFRSRSDVAPKSTRSSHSAG